VLARLYPPQLTLSLLRHLGQLSSVTSNDDSTEAVIQRMIEAKWRFIREGEQEL